jgi:hypothetical protein
LPEREIKEQRQEESVLSKQQLENKTPESSHRQINTTHFDRLSNENSKKDAKESQQNISESRGSHQESARQSNHNSLTSIRQAEEVQEASLPPAQPSSVSSCQKESEAKPKEYLPQQSSKKTISNPSESRQHIAPSENEPQSQKQSFYRNFEQSNVPIYVARPSPLQPQPQQRRESSQSQSGSKTKVHISYGQPSDKSIEIKRRDPPREMAGSQVSRVSMHSSRIPP